MTLFILFSGVIPFAAALLHRHKIHGESKLDISKSMLWDYTDEAYPLWRRQHGGCPASLADLNEYTNRGKSITGNPDTNDAWGRPMVMTCGETGLTVRSAGKDGVFDSSDDLQLMSAASAATRSTE